MVSPILMACNKQSPPYRFSIRPLHVPTLGSRRNYPLRAFKAAWKHNTMLYDMTSTGWSLFVFRNRSHTRCHTHLGRHQIWRAMDLHGLLKLAVSDQ